MRVPASNGVPLLTKPPPHRHSLSVLHIRARDGERRRTPIITPSFTTLHLPPPSRLTLPHPFKSAYSCRRLGEPEVERLKTPRSNRFFLAEEEPRRDTGYIKDSRSPLYYLVWWMKGGAGGGEGEGRRLPARVFALVLPINSEFLCEWIAGAGLGLMDKQCSSA